MEVLTSDTKSIDLVLELLFQKCGEAEYRKMCEILDAAYLDEEGKLKDNFRHRYSAVSGKLNELKNSRREFVDTYGLASITGNAEGLYEYARAENKPYVNNLFKLLDHIGLEIARIDYKAEIWDKIQENSEYSRKIMEEYQVSINVIEDIKRLYDQAAESTRKNRKQIEAASRTIQEKENEIIKKTGEVNNLLADTKQKVESLQKDYIAILGILAAILITFTSGSIFSSSVLANIHQSSRYRISFICVLLGFILFNVVAFLMLFIKWIVQIEKEAFVLPAFLKKIDIALFILLLLAGAAWFFDLGRLAEIIRELLYKGIAS